MSDRRPSISHSPSTIEGKFVLCSSASRLDLRKVRISIISGFTICAIVILLGMDKTDVEHEVNKLWLDPNGLVAGENEYIDEHKTKARLLFTRWRLVL